MLVQIIIDSSASNGNFFTVPFVGICNIKILNYQYHATGGANAIIQMRSDKLILNNSQSPYYCFITLPSSYQNVDNSSSSGISYRGVQLNGQIQLAVTTTAGATPAGFQFFIVTLDIEEIALRSAPLPYIGNGTVSC
jgi:hypothetical protein